MVRRFVPAAGMSYAAFPPGGLVAEWIGLWWLLLGMVASNLSGELATVWAMLT